MTEEQRQESFQRWLEQKRIQTEKKRAEKIMTEFRTNSQLEHERNKLEQQKEGKLNKWIRKKEEEIKGILTN